MVGCEGKKRMSWWAVPVIGVLGVLGLVFGWLVGSFLVAMRDEPMNIWEDWED